MTTTSNAYCAALGISPPRIDDAKASPDANYYSLLIIALLERGGPMTLAEAAARFAAAGLTSSVNEALAALKRCKPARSPIYRDGDSYALDPHDDEVVWLARLGLRPPRSAPLRVAPNASGPLPSADQPLTVAALDEAWREGVPNSWSAQRVAVAVLDAHPSPMSSDDVIAFVSARSRWSPLRPESAQFWRSGAIVVREDGAWELERTHEVVRSAREAVRNRVSDIRRWAAMRPDTVAMEAHRQRIERERTAHARELAAMRRVLVHAFPATRPRESLYALYQYGRLHGCVRLRLGFLDERLGGRSGCCAHSLVTSAGPAQCWRRRPAWAGPILTIPDTCCSPCTLPGEQCVATATGLAYPLASERRHNWSGPNRVPG